MSCDVVRSVNTALHMTGYRYHAEKPIKFIAGRPLAVITVELYGTIS